jgi:hypothetical protein
MFVYLFFVYLSVSLSVWFSVCLSVSLSVCLFVCLSIYLFVCLFVFSNFRQFCTVHTVVIRDLVTVAALLIRLYCRVDWYLITGASANISASIFRVVQELLQFYY